MLVLNCNTKCDFPVVSIKGPPESDTQHLTGLEGAGEHSLGSHMGEVALDWSMKLLYLTAPCGEL